MRNRISRRMFMGAAMSMPLAAYGAAPKRKFTMALSGGPIGLKADTAQLISFAERYGFESVAPGKNDIMGYSDAQAAACKAEMAAKGLGWAAMGVGADIRAKSESDFAAQLKELPKVSKAMQRVGATRVKTWLSPAHNELTYLQNFRQHADRIKRIGQVLEDYGIRFGLEYVGPKTSWTARRYPFVHTLAEARELIAATGQTNVGLVLDSWHWYTAEETGADLLALTNNDVVSCDLNDAPAGIPVHEQKDSRRALPMATGVIDLKTFMEALVQIGYDGPVQAEPFSAELRAMEDDAAVRATAAAMKQAFALVE